ncbi:MAG TPA: NAD(P)H-dependent oxidoreductase subunit E [Deltaproteobacteria bacterium]|nr:NAD(P)H-dependent oxidoreductase subunit E [Deltaproteobacteria bacterium]HCP44473.1 NAD(P)H-dependent oxidoreductase subunit E [Deltaproteobacteria bacterium]
MSVDTSHLEFSAAARERVEWLRTRYPKDHQRALILPVLSMAQREFGRVGPDVVHFVAEQIPVPPMWVEEVATFYTMYNTQPVGRWHLQVCHNISCSLMGAEIVIDHLEQKLGIRKGETTPDGEFTLIGAECLGSCGTAPMMQVNDHYYENLSLKAVDELLEQLRATPDQEPRAEDLPHGPGSGPSRRIADGAALQAGRGVVVPGHGVHRRDEDRPTVGDGEAQPPFQPRDMAQ